MRGGGIPKEEKNQLMEFFVELDKGEIFKAAGVTISFSKNGLCCGLEVEGKGMTVAEMIFNLKEKEILNAMEPVKKALKEAAISLSNLIIERHSNLRVETQEVE